MLKTDSIYSSFDISSKWVITTINGKLNTFANSKWSVSNFDEFLGDYLPETIHKAYSGKYEHKLEISCFSAFLCPPTSMNDSSLFTWSNHFSSEIMFCWLTSFPVESNPMTWWLLVKVVPVINSFGWVNTFSLQYPLPSSFYPLLSTPSRVLFPLPLSPKSNNLISSLIPCLCTCLTMSSTMRPLSPSETLRTMTSVCILEAR